MQVLCANAATFILKGWWKRHIHLVKACKINSLIRALFWSPMVKPCLLSESHLLCNMHLNAYWSVNINTDTVHSRSRRLYSVCTQQHQLEICSFSHYHADKLQLTCQSSVLVPGASRSRSAGLHFPLQHPETNTTRHETTWETQSR